MTPSIESQRLTDKYDELYQNEKLDPCLPDRPVEKVGFSGLPASRKEALLYLARPGGRLLEIGCGTGEVIAALAGQYQEILGIELSHIRSERARYNLRHVENATVVSRALEQLSPDRFGTFDAIIWADVIEHVVDVVKAMRVLATLSRPGTQLVTVTPNVAFLPQRLNILRGRAPNTALPWYPNEGFSSNPKDTLMLDAGHLHYFTYRQIELLYEIGGFLPYRRLGIGNRFGRLHNWFPTLLSGQVCVTGYFTGP